MIILSPIFVIREIYLVMNHLKFQIFIVRSDIFFIVADNGFGLGEGGVRKY